MRKRKTEELSHEGMSDKQMCRLGKDFRSFFDADVQKK